MVGLPAAGKTHRAKELAAELGALRLTPDEWMIPLFAHNDADGKRWVLEGRLIWVARELLRQGTSVILDFGLWGRDERSALKDLARSCDAQFRFEYLTVNREEQLARVARRAHLIGVTTFETPPEDLLAYETMFEAPTEEEVASTDAGPPPAGYDNWDDWIAWRWPSSRLDERA